MTTKNILKDIYDNGGLDINVIIYSARRDKCSIKSYIYDYVKNNYDCSKYVCSKVTDRLYYQMI